MAVAIGLTGCATTARPAPQPVASAISAKAVPQFATVHGPNALWTIVSQQCVPDLLQNASAAPCTLLNDAGQPGGYAILKDIQGKSQYLLIPTEPVRGIESPALLQPQTPGYFAFAWDHRNLVAVALARPLPDDALSLAINPVRARSQQQLHIHVDCLGTGVRQALAQHAKQIDQTWRQIEADGRSLNVRRMTYAQFNQTNLFKLVADTVPGASSDMGGESLLVTGAGPVSEVAGVFLIEDNFDQPGQGRWAAEALQDHACR